MANWPVLSGADDAAFAQQNLLQTEKQDRDGQIPVTGVQQWKKGADVASAPTLTLGTDGNYFDVTGAVGITSIVQLAVGGAQVQAGTVVKLHFDGAPLITHHASNLILPGGINIQAAANDEAEFTCYDGPSALWRCTNYLSASGPGTFEAGISFGGGTTGITYNGAYHAGLYTKRGNLVTISGNVTLTSKGSSNGIAAITGLPFISTALTGGDCPVVLFLNNITFANQYQGVILPGSGTIDLWEITEAGAMTELTDANFANNSSVRFSCTYRID